MDFIRFFLESGRICLGVAKHSHIAWPPPSPPHSVCVTNASGTRGYFRRRIWTSMIFPQDEFLRQSPGQMLERVMLCSMLLSISHLFGPWLLLTQQIVSPPQYSKSPLQVVWGPEELLFVSLATSCLLSRRSHWPTLLSSMLVLLLWTAVEPNSPVGKQSAAHWLFLETRRSRSHRGSPGPGVDRLNHATPTGTTSLWKYQVGASVHYLTHHSSNCSGNRKHYFV